MATPIAVEPEYFSQEFTQGLGEKTIRFVISWNQRAGSYSVDVYTQDRTPIVTGLRVVMGADIWGRVEDDRIPEGALIAIDTETDNVPPGKGELGARVKLVFQPPPEGG